MSDSVDDNTPPTPSGCIGTDEAGNASGWAPSWEIRQASKIPVINQAERELLMLVELCAPAASQHRLAHLVIALVTFAESAWKQEDSALFLHGSEQPT